MWGHAEMERDKLDRKAGPRSQSSFYEILQRLNFILKVIGVFEGS